MIKISVIIPTYNRDSLLNQVITSFLNQSFPKSNYEIIISDNNSSDATKANVDKLCSENPGRIKYVYEKRQGVHYARNTAAKAALGEVLYFTDDDMIADFGLLSNVIETFKLDKELGVVTGLILPLFQQEPPLWVRKHMINSYLSLTDASRQESLIISNVDMGVFSCHQAIKREVFFMAGGFNPENTAGIWLGDGETGLNLKIRDLKYKFAYSKNSVIYHVIPPTRMTLNYLILRIGNQGNCDAYSEFRQHRSLVKLLYKMMYRNIFGIFRDYISTVRRVFLGSENWRILIAKIFYFKNRNNYDIKIIFNKKFRKLVEVDDWTNSF